MSDMFRLFEEHTSIATTATYDSCTRLAREFTRQFDDAYDGAASAGSAVADVETRVRSSLTFGVTTATKRRAE